MKQEELESLRVKNRNMKRSADKVKREAERDAKATVQAVQQQTEAYLSLFFFHFFLLLLFFLSFSLSSCSFHIFFASALSSLYSLIAIYLRGHDEDNNEHERRGTQGDQWQVGGEREDLPEEG